MRKIFITLVLLSNILLSNQQWHYSSSNHNLNNLTDEPKVIATAIAENKAKEISKLIKESILSYWSSSNDILYVPTLKGIEKHLLKKEVFLGVGYKLSLDYNVGAIFLNFTDETYAVGISKNITENKIAILLIILLILTAIYYGYNYLNNKKGIKWKI